MDRRSIIVVWHIIMMIMMMVSWGSARNMALLHQGGEVMQSPLVMQQEGLSSRVGSRPPGCEHKCRGCSPCSPIQVPTAGLGPQYANYEPEGWKCHCGSIIFNP